MRWFDADAVTVDDGAEALAVIEALLRFAGTASRHELDALRAQEAPLCAAIASGDRRGIARAILTTLRSTLRIGRSRAGVAWDELIRDWWAAVDDRERALAGLEGARLLLSRQLRHQALRREADELAAALRADGGGAPRRAIAAARAWGRRTARDVEHAAATYWADGVPTDPDWKILGEPPPAPSASMGTSTRFPPPGGRDDPSSG